MSYGVILADPPWSYRVGASHRGTAEREYSTMADAEICRLPIGDLAKPDAVLLLWCTWPKLREGLEVVKAWGFEYLTTIPWVKITSLQNDLFDGEPRIEVPYGVGFWARGASEPLFVCKRGKPAQPRTDPIGLLSPNLYHSRKPDSVYEYAEALDGPYCELFARRKRDGWGSWGNEIDSDLVVDINPQCRDGNRGDSNELDDERGVHYANEG